MGAFDFYCCLFVFFFPLLILIARKNKQLERSQRVSPVSALNLANKLFPLVFSPIRLPSRHPTLAPRLSLALPCWEYNGSDLVYKKTPPTPHPPSVPTPTIYRHEMQPNDTESNYCTFQHLFSGRAASPRPLMSSELIRSHVTESLPRRPAPPWLSLPQLSAVCRE